MPLLTLQLTRLYHSTYKGAFFEAVTFNPNFKLVLVSETCYFVIRLYIVLLLMFCYLLTPSYHGNGISCFYGMALIKFCLRL